MKLAESSMAFRTISNQPVGRRQFRKENRSGWSIGAGGELALAGNWRARAGYTPVDRVMVYSTGGLAYGKVRTDFDYGLYRSSKTRFGWTIGAGAEYAPDASWTLKSEYLYTDFGKSTVSRLRMTLHSTWSAPA